MKGHHLMKTTIDMSKYEARHRKRGLLLSLLCAGVVATFLAGCANTGYVTAYDEGYYYPTGNSVRDYWGYYQSYPYSDTYNGPRYRIIDGMHVYEPYYYGSYYSH
jgi:hypothetical protein